MSAERAALPATRQAVELDRYRLEDLGDASSGTNRLAYPNGVAPVQLAWPVVGAMAAEYEPGRLHWSDAVRIGKAIGPGSGVVEVLEVISV